MIENRVFYGDCVQGLKRYTDKYFDLAIVDPPYGIGDKFKGGKSGKMNFNEIVDKDWDSVPSKEYWNELFRVSKNQVVWGGNYFDLPPTRCFLIWDKQIGEDFSLAMCEYAWTSFDKLAKIFKGSNPKINRLHPTQKPIRLYDWILKNYSEPNIKILDTHVGSGSSRISCFKAGLDFTGFEIDKEYYDAQEKRFKDFTSQLRLGL